MTARYRIPPDLEICAKKIREHHLKVLDSHRTMLHHAKRAGDYLNDAKAQVPSKKWMRWVKVKLNQQEGKNENLLISHRTATEYMRIANHWKDHVGPQLKENPDLSINQAIYGLRKRQRAPSKKFDLGSMALDKIFHQVKRKATDRWTEEEKQDLRDAIGYPEIEKLYLEAFDKLRKRVKQVQGKQLTKKEIKQELKKATERYRLRLQTQKEGDSENRPTEGDVIPVEHNKKSRINKQKAENTLIRHNIEDPPMHRL